MRRLLGIRAVAYLYAVWSCFAAAQLANEGSTSGSTNIRNLIDKLHVVLSCTYECSSTPFPIWRLSAASPTYNHVVCPNGVQFLFSKIELSVAGLFCGPRSNFVNR